MNKSIFLSLSSLAIIGILCNATKSTSTKVDYGVLPKTEISNETIVDEGAVGDVKFSILKPELFIEANGSGWVLMKGQPFTEFKPDVLIMKEQELFNIDGNYKLPDARGVFLRGMNENREEKEGNPYKNVPLGKWYPDLTIKHNHDILDGHGNATNSAIRFMLNQNNNGNNNHFDGGGPNDPPYGWYEGLTTKNYGETNLETVPRHISLFIYVKVRKSTSAQK